MHGSPPTALVARAEDRAQLPKLEPPPGERSGADAGRVEPLFDIAQSEHLPGSDFAGKALEFVMAEVATLKQEAGQRARVVRYDDRIGLG